MKLKSFVDQTASAIETDVKAGFSLEGKTKTYSSSGVQQHFIASTTKTFTTVIIFKMAELGMLELEQSVSDWVDVEILAKICHESVSPSHISVRQLLSHTSGIPDYYKLKPLKPGEIESQTKQDPGWGFDEVLALTGELRMKSYNPNKADYSGTNYHLLEKIIEHSFSSYEAALDELVLKPLGLSQTFMFRNPSQLSENISRLKYDTENYLGYKRMGSLGAEGGMVSTIEETLVFFDQLFSGKLLAEQSLAQLVNPTSKLRFGLSYGAGVMVTKSALFGRRGLIGHIGATGHFAFYDPKTRASFAGTINNFRSHKNLLGLIRKTVAVS